MPRPLVLTEAALLTPGDRLTWTTPQMWDPVKRHPTWLTGEAGKTFFALSRWTLGSAMKLAQGHPDLPDLEPLRARGSSERYLLRLYDIELLAHHMAELRRIKPGKLGQVILMVKTCAQVHGYL